MAGKVSKAVRVLSRAFFALFAVLVTSSPRAAEAASAAGKWQGAIRLPGAELVIDVDLQEDAGTWNGDISIPAQGAKDLALTNVTLRGEDVSFDLPGIAGEPSFRGRLSPSGDQIAGDFAQGGQTFRFELKRAGSGAAAARAALAGFPAFVEQARKDWKVPGFALAVVYEGEVLLAEGFGQRNVERDLSVTPQTLFAIGSASKAFTTFAMGTLVDEGKLDWDQPVAGYLPHFRLHDDFATNHITPRDLVTHRSGLPRHDLAWYNNKELSREDMIARLRYFEPNKQLRETFQYNNMMFLAAGYLVGRLHGGTWEEAVEARIFKPLGMTESNFSVESSQQGADFAMPYEDKDDVVRSMPFRNIDNVGPAGSINSNLEDMTRWLKLHLAGGKLDGQTVISPETLREMHTPQMAIAALPEEAELSPASYGLGWFVRTYRGHLQVEHGGAIDGFIAAVTLFPNDKLGIVAFANMNGSALPSLMTRHAADRVLGLSYKDWNGEALEKWRAGKQAAKAAEEKKDMYRKVDTRPTYALEEYTGVYEHPGYGMARIEYDGGQLVMTYNAIVTPLEHWHYDVFSGTKGGADSTFENMRVQFLSNLKGDIDRLELPLEPTMGSIVFKRNPDPRLSDPNYIAQFVGVYELAKTELTIGMHGRSLTLSVPGQPLYELVPDRNNEFNLKAIPGFSIRFQPDATEGVAAFLNQPNGVFELRRKVGASAPASTE